MTFLKFLKDRLKGYMIRIFSSIINTKTKKIGFEPVDKAANNLVVV